MKTAEEYKKDYFKYRRSLNMIYNYRWGKEIRKKGFLTPIDSIRERTAIDQIIQTKYNEYIENSEGIGQRIKHVYS